MSLWQSLYVVTAVDATAIEGGFSVFSSGVVDVRELFKKVVELYNRYRAPEAIASVVGIENSIAIIKFSGYFCVTCGVIDWIEDYIYILKDLGVDTEITKIEYNTENNHIIVEIKIKQSSEVELH